MKSEVKKCKKCRRDFVVEPNDFGFYEKIGVPVPEACPECRFKARAMFRNEMTLYSGRKCGLCGKGVISMYHPKSPYTIYCHKCFYGGGWDPGNYAMDYDPGRSFVSQLGELFLKVPKITTYLSVGEGANVGSEYVNMAGACKNCYMVFNTSHGEDALYSRGLRKARDSCDMYFAKDIERCYESINIGSSSGVLWGKNITGSVDCAFVSNCRGLVSCFGCVNLNNKSYHFLNKPMDKIKYKKKVTEIMGSYSKAEKFKKEFEEFALGFPMRQNNNIKTVGSTGDYLFECKNALDSFEVTSGEDCRYIFSSERIKDSMDVIGYGANSEKLLEVVATGNSSNVIGSWAVENSKDILFGSYLGNCTDCLGCDALRNKKYSILNKEYSKAEYEKLREKIITELRESKIYGSMMPAELAPFAYNETIAQDNFPLTKGVAQEQGYRFEDDIQKTLGQETIKPHAVPDHIEDIPDSITDEVLACINCSRNYKITNQELLFYRKMSIPLPRKCFFCRHRSRVARRGPYKFTDRDCDKCHKKIFTNYSSEYTGVVYCEKCYQGEVY
jgi:hypothetical protein